MTRYPDGESYPYGKSFLANEGPLILPEYFKDFKVVRPLGRGRSSRVFQLASPTGKDYALKVTICSTPHQTNSAIREYALLQRLSGCPHVIRVYDFRLEVSPRGLVSAWLLEEYAGVLNVWNPAFSFPSRLKAAVAVCEALIEIKKRGVAHLDIKPANVFRGKDGLWKLGDFSHAMPLSALGQISGVVGSPGYIAPETRTRRHYSEQTDIYSMGIFLYRLFTGELPFPPDRPETPQPPFPRRALPDALYRVISTAANDDPEERFPTFEALLDALMSLQRSDLPPEGSLNTKGRPDDRPPTQGAIHTFGDTFSFGSGEGGRYWYAEATWSTLGG